MLLTLTLVILFAAIAVFFSQEFLGFFKKILEIKGMKLLLPLLVASWFVFTFDYGLVWGIVYYREILSGALAFLVYFIPFQKIAEYVSLVIVLTTISVLPVYLIDLVMRKRSFKSYAYPNITSLLIFVVSTLVLLAF